MRYLISLGHGVVYRGPVELKFLLLVLLVIGMLPTVTAQRATVVEKNVTMKTYPYSDPNPIASPVNMAPNMYPYFKFDGFTNEAIEKEWKVVELENDYIKVLIFPEIGGKVWTAIEKKTNQHFLYNNHVVKFRDIAMRGAWTSGGIEFNFGILGHTPNSASPVDYLIRENDDGSVSCFVGTLDLITRTNWRVEINLPADKAYFTTRTFWHNSEPTPQPYYHWTNAAISTQGNLEFIFPGHRYIGHGGEVRDWPIHPNGKDLSFYEQNDFGSYKAYHVFGKNSGFFGAYWHQKNLGIGHYTLKDEKPGRKIWIWGLSGQGMIWEKILSDSDGQYAEIQSGKHFNQNSEASSFTPFKQMPFMPYSAQEWLEYWFPVLHTEGITTGNPLGTLHVKKTEQMVKLLFSPLAEISDSIVVRLDGKQVYSRKVDLKPLELFADSVAVDDVGGNLQVVIGDDKLVYAEASKEDTISRPLFSPKGVEQSAHYWYRIGADRIAQRYYTEAQEFLDKALAKDPFHVPALVALAELKFYELKYDSAAFFSKKALAIDTYDGAANYFFGLASLELDKIHDAEDAFSIAAASTAYQSAAYTELARLNIRLRQWDAALLYADKAIDVNRKNLVAYSIKSIAYRYLHVPEKVSEALKRVLDIDPMNHFAHFELYSLDSTKMPFQTFIDAIRSEMPEQTMLELAIFYYEVGCLNEAETLFTHLTSSPEANYWLAWIYWKTDRDFRALIERGDSLSANMVFPFRQQTAKVLDWVGMNSKSWKSRYYLALVHRNHNNLDTSSALLEACGEEPDFAPFYITRMNMYPDDTASRRIHIQKAISLDSCNWRYQVMLTEYYLALGQYRQALSVIEPFAKRDQTANGNVGLLYVRTLLMNKQYEKADNLLNNLHLISFEGSTLGYDLYREVKLMLAVEMIGAKKYRRALDLIEESRIWPERLGAGKPYDEDVDTQLQDYLEATCFKALHQERNYRAALDKVVNFPDGYRSKPSSSLVKAWVLDAQDGKNSGLEFLKRKLNDNPANKVVQWGLHVYQGIPYTGFEDGDLDADMRIMDAFAKFN